MNKILCALTERECAGICPEKRIERGVERKCPAEYIEETKGGERHAMFTMRKNR